MERSFSTRPSVAAAAAALCYCAAHAAAAAAAAALELQGEHAVSTHATISFFDLAKGLSNLDNTCFFIFGRVMSNLKEIVSHHDFCDVRKNTGTGQHGIFASCPFTITDILINFGSSKIITTPDCFTLQISEDQHIYLNPDFLQYTNHSCTPNVLFNTATMELECIQNIKIGDELCFFYPATEWSMSSPFICNCGSAVCIGQVQGAINTPLDILKKYKLTSFVQSKLDKWIGGS